MQQQQRQQKEPWARALVSGVESPAGSSRWKTLVFSRITMNSTQKREVLGWLGVPGWYGLGDQRPEVSETFQQPRHTARLHKYYSSVPFPATKYPCWLVCWKQVQFSSAAQSCPTLCDPMNRNMPGVPVHHQLPESTQTHVHQVGDAIQPSHPLSSPSPPTPNPSQH